MIRKILVYANVLAESHPAIARAMKLNRHFDAELKIVDVAKSPPGAEDDLHHPMRSIVELEQLDRLEFVCEPLRQQHIGFSSELLRGRPFVEIVREVVHDGFHLMIKTAGATERTDVMGMMGPVDMRLVRNCPCPVWIESPDSEVHCERVLVAVDPQAEDDQLNRSLLDLGLSLAGSERGELHVVSAWNVPDEEFLSKKMTEGNFSSYIDDVETLAEEQLASLLKNAGIKRNSDLVHFRKGNAARTIIDYVETCEPDVLVLGTVSHTETRGLLIGNTAETVLRQINCSVLAVKPDSLFRT